MPRCLNHLVFIFQCCPPPAEHHFHRQSPLWSLDLCHGPGHSPRHLQRSQCGRQPLCPCLRGECAERRGCHSFCRGIDGIQSCLLLLETYSTLKGTERLRGKCEWWLHNFGELWIQRLASHQGSILEWWMWLKVEIMQAILDFFGIFCASFLVGSLMGCITALLTKFTHIRQHPLLESTLFVLMSYSTFLLAEVFGLTGIVAVRYLAIWRYWVSCVLNCQSL